MKNMNTDRHCLIAYIKNSCLPKIVAEEAKMTVFITFFEGFNYRAKLVPQVSPNIFSKSAYVLVFWMKV